MAQLFATGIYTTIWTLPDFGPKNIRAERALPLCRQYRKRQNHKSEELFQITKNPAGEKIAEEPAESLARHQNCQFRENVRGANFKGSQLLKLLQAQKKKEVRKA